MKSVAGVLGLLLVIVCPPCSAVSKVHDIPLRGDGTTALYWTLDYPHNTIRFEVHVLRKSSKSWFAIGFSNFGETESADYCLFWVDWRKNTHLQDVWTDEQGVVHLDHQQDCHNFHHSEEGKILKFSFKRKFNTCDYKDYTIEDGTTHIVWVEGAGPLYSVEGLNINNNLNHSFQRSQLLKNEKVQFEQPNDMVKMELRNNHVLVPSDDTTYWCHIFKLPDSFKIKHHAIRYEAVISEGSEHLVHHMELFHCETNANTTISDYSGSCFHHSRPQDTQVCKRVLAAWAMGALPFSYPKEAGLPFGGPDFNLYVMLEIHYNNPELHSGHIDSSGVRMYITPTLRKYDAGVMELGLEYIDKMAIPPKQPAFPLTGYCITECTAVGLPEGGIVVFGSQLHAHLTGFKIFTKHFRNGKELAELNRDNHFSQHYQEIRRLKEPVRVLPGDALITTCYYNTMDRGNATLGGFAITDEMCVNYIHYYPKTDLEVCKSSISYQDLHSYFDFLHRWEEQDTDSNKPISENYNAVDWTPMRVEVLNDLYAHSTLSMQCNHSSGERFPGNWEGVKTPRVRQHRHQINECTTLN